MSFVPLLLLFLLYLQSDWPAAPFGLEPTEAIGLTIIAHLTLVLAAAGLSFWSRHRLRTNPAQRPAILRSFARGKTRIAFLAVAVFVGSLYGLGWGWAMGKLIVGWQAPLLKPMLLLPYIATMILSWLFQYETDRTAHDDFWGRDDYHSRTAYLVLHLRHHFLLLVPPLLFMIGQETLHLFLGQDEQSNESPLYIVAVPIGLLAVATILLPYLLRILLGLKPLPAGPLRDHLTATARRLNFRFSDILVWNTRDTQANALVTGMLPVMRYIVLTDRLLSELSTDEVEAVFGHEVGHIKHHHMPFYAIFLILSMGILGAVFGAMEKWGLPMLAENGSIVAEIAGHREWFLLALVAYIFLCFGFLSRRCERQADLFGCHVAGFPAFISALEKVADINGISRERPGWFSAWQHGTIAERIDFLRRTVVRPELESTFQRRFGWLKWGSMMSLSVLVGVLLVCQAPGDWWKCM